MFFHLSVHFAFKFHILDIQGVSKSGLGAGLDDDRTGLVKEVYRVMDESEALLGFNHLIMVFHRVKLAWSSFGHGSILEGLGTVRECLSPLEQAHEEASRPRVGGQMLCCCVVIDLLQTDDCRNDGTLASKFKMHVPGTVTSFHSLGVPQEGLCSSVVHHHWKDGRSSRPHLKATKSYHH